MKTNYLFRLLRIRWQRMFIVTRNHFFLIRELIEDSHSAGGRLLYSFDTRSAISGTIINITSRYLRGRRSLPTRQSFH